MGQKVCRCNEKHQCTYEAKTEGNAECNTKGGTVRRETEGQRNSAASWVIVILLRIGMALLVQSEMVALYYSPLPPRSFMNKLMSINIQSPFQSWSVLSLLVFYLLFNKTVCLFYPQVYDYHCGTCENQPLFLFQWRRQQFLTLFGYLFEDMDRLRTVRNAWSFARTFIWKICPEVKESFSERVHIISEQGGSMSCQFFQQSRILFTWNVWNIFKVIIFLFRIERERDI